MASETLVNSIGVNTHIGTYYSQSDFTTVIARLKSLGIKHIRDGILDNDAPFNKAVVQMLSATGAKLDGITDCPGIEYYPQSVTTASDIRAFDAAIGSRLEAVEGPNEVDSRNDKNWAVDTRNCLPSLRGAETSLPFIAPSIANQLDNASKLGNISPDVDLGNGHRYFSGRNPGTSGWGATGPCGTYGALPWALCEIRINSGSKPVYLTESGYNTQTEVDEPTQAKYISRLFFVNLRAGVARTYVYDLKDYVGGDGFGGDGLLRTDNSEKPAYYAIASVISAFTDSTATPKLTPLKYSIESGPTVEHLLFEKADGTYLLAIWNEASSWNPDAKSRIAISAQNVTLRFPFSPESVAANSISDSGSLTTKSTSASTDTITVSVDDHLTIVHFKVP
jgi:hypothetical protein